MSVYTPRHFVEHTAATYEAVIHENVKAPLQITIEARRQPDDLAVVAFLPGLGLRLSIAEDIAAGHRRDMIMNRLFSVLQVLVQARVRHGSVIGEEALWLDDFPSGPGLCFSGNSVEHTLIPDSEFWLTEGYATLRGEIDRSWVPWQQRRTPIFWRGSSTGSRQLLMRPSWRDIPRFRLALLVQELNRPDLFDIALSGIVQIQLDWEQREIDAEVHLQPYVSPVDFLAHRHSVDIDGNSSSWSGLMSRMLMANTVVKIGSAVGFRQWYYDRLLPWKHFVPVPADMSTLLETAEWLLASPRESEQIAEAGLGLARSLTVLNELAGAGDVVANAVARTKCLPRPVA
jgi:hypothetical protein